MAVALAFVGTVALSAVALGAHPVPGAVYAGNSGDCAATIRQKCVFKFRVSRDGRTLEFVKRGETISSWACRGGGGEAIFGSGTYAYRVPRAQIHSDGAFVGSSGAGSRKLLITGRFNGSGNSATLRFVLPNQHCHTSQLKIFKH